MFSLDYSILSDREFEILATRTVATIRNESTYQVFSRGKDGGVDGYVLYHKEEPSTRILVQAKKHKRFNDAQLRAELSNLQVTEYSEYVLVLACPLSREKSDNFGEIARRYLPNKDFLIIGKETLDLIVHQHQYLLELFPQLFIPTTSMLESAINSEVLLSSQQRLLDFEKSKQELLHTPLVDQILTILNEHRICTITGQAGIGKTTSAFLAANRIVEQSEEQSEVFPPRIIFINAIGEVWKTSRYPGGTIYIVDDFLGETRLTNEAGFRLSEFSNVFSKIKNSSGDYMILATRDYILREFRNHRLAELTDPFKSSEICIQLEERTSKLIVLVALLRKKVLYLRSHDQQENITERFQNAIKFDKAYRKILSLPVFNPRAMEVSLRGIPVLDENTIPEILANISNSRNALEAAEPMLSPEDHRLLQIIALNEPIKLSQCQVMCSHIGINHKNQLMRIDGIWIKIQPPYLFHENEPKILLPNPSVREFIRETNLRDSISTRALVNTALKIGSGHNLIKIINNHPFPTRELRFNCITTLINEVLLFTKKYKANIWELDCFGMILIEFNFNESTFPGLTFEESRSVINQLISAKEFNFIIDLESFIEFFTFLHENTRFDNNKQLSIQLLNLCHSDIFKNFSLSDLDELAEWLESLDENQLTALNVQELVDTLIPVLESSIESNFGVSSSWDSVESELVWLEDSLDRIALLEANLQFYAPDWEDLKDRFNEFWDEEDLSNTPRRGSSSTRSLQDVLTERTRVMQDEAELINLIFE